ncbi:MAG: UDP-glucose 4-epimerase GalE [Pseudomonadota bacterium]
MAKKILLTGGAGYIGSHTYVALKGAGFEPVIFDNFSNAKEDVAERLEQICGEPVQCVHGDVLSPEDLRGVFEAHDFEGVVHFSALKAVGESTEKPRAYFHTNLGGLLNLLSAMRESGCKVLVFSSSATVYGDAQVQPISETAPCSFTNPYGYTKFASEQMLEQIRTNEPDWVFGVLRYFNPVGAHTSALIGEDPQGLPNNLMPYIAKVATGELPHLTVFGDDYPTKDGSGVRDYIHVMDVARGHVLSLNKLFETGESHLVNLGTGQGYSVFDILNAYSDACGKDLAHVVGPRREGDVAQLLAGTELAQKALGFKARYDLKDMCESSWAWMESQKT